MSAPRGKRPLAGEAVVDKAFKLLTAFNPGESSLSLTALSTRTQIPLSTVFRLARKLVEWGALERTDAGNYVVGLKLLELASLAPRGHGLRTVAMPFMEDLHLATRQHVLLAVRDNDEAVLVERLSAHEAGRIMYRIGGRVPLHSTGVGMVLLAHAPTNLQEEILGGPLRLEPEGNSLSGTELRRRLASVRQEGLAVAVRPWPEPAISVAVPIFGASRTVIAALSVVGPVGVVEPKNVTPAVVAVGRAISRAASKIEEASLGQDS